MLRRAALTVALALAGAAWLPAAAPAQQGETLADIRQDISVLVVELRRLKQELNTTGGSDVALPAGTLARIDAIEAELQRITAKTEELEFRIARVVEDGTVRLGTLNLRLCEIEPGCDLADLEAVPPLGGEAPPQTAAAAPAPAPSTDAPGGTGELAVGEETDFREARAALEAGDFAAAAQAFAEFRATYPQGPLEAAALVGEGRALVGLGDTREAARRFLTAYSDYPEAPVAAEALWRLGVQLGALGSTREACITLAEVPNRYPGSDFVARAAESRAALGCG